MYVQTIMIIYLLATIESSNGVFPVQSFRT